MTEKPKILSTVALAMSLATSGTGWPGQAPSSPSAATFPNDDKTISHVLNRIAFGPKPGDAEDPGDIVKVRELGLQRYIDQQLHPERIPDSGMSARLAGLATIGMSSREIVERFELPQLEARRERREQQAEAGEKDGQPPNALSAMQQKANRVVLELSEQKLLRSVYSERQLQEVLADFWFNHFNVDARKGRDRFLLTQYDRDAIRPHVLGKFRDLLEATAKSPAMLFYLDNWMSADPSGPHMDMSQPLVRGGFGRRGRLGGGGLGFPSPQRAAQNAASAKKAPRGLNENYGRELMELHTLGVEGGYTQKDVTEVARAFTGWTIQNPRQGGEFRFEPRIHDVGEKIVLGHRIKAGGGSGDGEQVLDILATHPSTARFIATKLARRFVSDTPPPRLIDRVAARFHDTGGDLRDVMREILTSPEFLSPDAYRAKVKTPLEFVASAVRATGADVQDALPLVRAMQQLGMPLYFCQPPTGYKDTADGWVNTGALVARMNFALALASNQLPGVIVDGRQPTLDSQSLVNTILGGDISETTRATIARASDAAQMAALTLGAPEFQRR
ncbi:MAG: DUF1800 domain-containing protein [Acidobacteria bacterium]|nr:MAG: DUF1800 domain-containing protein [Acidobacteriota bacterium]